MFTDMAQRLIKDQNLVKCLYYTSPDALSLNDLTTDQRTGLIKQGQSTTRIRNIESSFLVTQEAVTELRIYEAAIDSSNIYMADIYYIFDILIHYSLWNLDKGRRRASIMATSILNCLNGQIINNGIGTLKFAERPLLKSMKFNENFLGYRMVATIKSV